MCAASCLALSAILPLAHLAQGLDDGRLRGRVHPGKRLIHEVNARVLHQGPGDVTFSEREGGIPVEGGQMNQVIVVQHWTEELKRLVPTD